MRLTTTLLAILLLFTGAAASQNFQVVHTFSGPDGSFPNGDLFRDAAGNFYGTTQFGGASNQGVVFKLDSSGKETVLYSFTGGSDGGIPIGRLVGGGGNFYGITSAGGDPTCSCGTVFKLDSTGKLTVLHSFTGGMDGAQNPGQPELGLVLIHGDFYGAASFGGTLGCDGSLGCGVIFKITPALTESVLYRFTAQADGGFPQDLIRDQSGNLYGATGGSYMAGNAGTVFRMDTAGNLTTLYTFPGGASGSSPRWRLVRAATGLIHGVTQFGGNTSCALGSIGCGAVFSLDATGKEKVLHTFGKQAGDGEEPSGGLLDVAGSFYGATFYGGIINSTCSFGCGVVYRVNDGGQYSVLYRFTGAADGWLPTGGLTADGSGNVLGTAELGGTGSGVVFKITP
ncbi:MAG TPA: choice-of-anchor tandem repeat GloVer-containing protein [Terriglobales bacterium]|nr:choice-of-anchor tandem repeat GloVer-containing protein [Terriglobales bacterium]